MSTTSAMHRIDLNERFDRLMFHLAWGSATAIFLSVGWTTMQAWDPKGPVSMLANGQPIRMMIEVLALAAVASALATAIAGRRFADTGLFSVGIALTLVAVRGQTMTYLLIDPDHRANLGLSLAMESIYWSVVILVAALCSAIVANWLHRGESGATGEQQVIARMTAAGIPVVGRLFLSPEQRTDQRDTLVEGLKHLLIVTVISLILIRVLSTGTVDREIRHGQACFALAVAFYVGTNRAQAYVPVVSNVWSCAAVPMTAIVAYLFAWMAGGSRDDAITPLPASAFQGILPIMFVGLGAAAVVFARWKVPSVSDVADD